MDHNRIKNLLQADPSINERVPRGESNIARDTSADTRVKQISRTESATDEVLPWTQRDLKASPARSTGSMDIPPFFSPLQTRAARRKNSGVATVNQVKKSSTAPDSKSGTVKAASKSTETPNTANRSRSTNKEAQPKARSRSKSRTRSRARSRSRSKSRSRKTKVDSSQSEGPISDSPVESENVVKHSSRETEESLSPKPSSAKRSRSKSLTRTESESDTSVSPPARG